VAVISIRRRTELLGVFIIYKKNEMKNLLTCFKYRDGNNAVRCLKDGTLYFAKPNELNDILEAKFENASIEDFSHVMTNAYSEVSQKRGGPALEFEQSALSELSIANAAENVKLQAFCEQIGIFSATYRPDHQAMWAYYAENCKGVCFELAWTAEIMDLHQLLPVDVTYSDHARIHNRADDCRMMFLDLADKHPHVSLRQLHQMSLEEIHRRNVGVNTVVRAASIKHTDWAHEKEIRIIAPRSGPIPVLSAVLKRVHFIRFDGEKMGEIAQLLLTRYPNVEIVHWTFDHGEITSNAKEMEFRLIPV
jgi:hypothetical protein